MHPTRFAPAYAGQHRRRGPRRLLGRGPGIALLASLATLVCALPASTAVAEPVGAEVVLHVDNPSGTATEPLQRLTLAQVVALLKTTSSELLAQIEALPGVSSLSAKLNELLGSPTTTLQGVINFLSAQGVDPTAVQQLINHLLAGSVETSDQLKATLNQVLADLGEDGQISALASELGLPAAVVELLRFGQAGVEPLASTLNTTTERLSSVLGSAGSALQPLISTAPLVFAPVEAAVGKPTTLVGLPGAAGGVSLTTVSSTSTPASRPATAAQAATPPSNAFSIVSIKVTKAGLIVEKVALPGPGRLSIKGTARKTLAVKSRRAHTRGRTRTAAIGSLARQLSGGIQTLTLRGGGAIKGAQRVILSLVTTYTPTGGSPNTIQRSLTIKRSANRKHN